MHRAQQDIDAPRTQLLIRDDKDESRRRGKVRAGGGGGEMPSGRVESGDGTLESAYTVSPSYKDASSKSPDSPSAHLSFLDAGGATNGETSLTWRSRWAGTRPEALSAALRCVSEVKSM